MSKSPVVALTGASGYIGQNLLKKIEDKADIIALSRNGDNYEDSEHIQWRSCDLYSMNDAEKALEGADVAVYLVHSMMPSAKLNQGSFEDMDVILADNFAQAAKKNNVKRIVYLTGIVPGDGEPLSRHLRSRLEVENILRAYGTPVTAIRAGLIVGPKGSSFPILAKLVKRLPIMVLPKWTRMDTQPIALPDVLNALDEGLENEEISNRSIDVGGPEVMTYWDMMLKTAAIMGRKPKAIPVPFITVKLSRLWVSMVTGASKEIVYPLIESLKHPMVVQKENYVEGISDGEITFEESAKHALESERQEGIRLKLPQLPSFKQDVRSVQRIILPAGETADSTALYYVEWLESLLNPWIRTTVDEEHCCKVGTSFSSKSLLELSYSRERSTADRALYYITGGLLTDSEKNSRGRLEFRKIPEKNELIVAIHEYMPSLPWFAYKYTQAFSHLIIMRLFSNHMKKKSNETVYSESTDPAKG
ncbi:NAD(P)H-binding protein [Salimicrobium salexigens]|uniref:Uncharacterized conserved protein YbjT, contains NAD(P)-binding and DUF2867 domains n=1 Tax=Salimicrobium salexigens TaxID=908941 RepID=A0ABY1KWU3_9BACI|nr:NAD(P)H-binding protein [Salimicrobium salexigens]SIS87760.1 Uncharacterized conserved protein YbjT, contains NAD(P)-binding and DUF2867 domains [Salimicrobium salexigens]